MVRCWFPVCCGGQREAGLHARMACTANRKTNHAVARWTQFKRALLVPLLILFSAGVSSAQSGGKIVQVPRFFEFCGSPSTTSHISSLYCFLPTFGVDGFLVFQSRGAVGKVNTLVGTELSLLPIASPASGITYTFDPKLGLVMRSVESFGPILSERSETLGAHRVFLGFTYQHFSFDSLDGQALQNPAANSLTAFQALLNVINTGSVTPQSPLALVSSIDEIKVDEFTTFLTYGLTNRIDVSAAFPVRRIRMQLRGFSFVFANSIIDPTLQTPVPVDFVPDVERREVTGLSDIILRVRGRVWRGEHAGLALGLDVRTPTGDPLDFLGSGAYGVKPFAVVSGAYHTKHVYWSPHLNIGYEFNGSSILGGTFIGQEGRLPRVLQYAIGAETGVVKKVTFSADLLGQKLFSAERNFRFFSDPTSPTGSAAEVFTNNVNTKDFSFGAKVNPWKNLLVTGNVAWRLDHGGLRARVVPLVGLSYTF